MIEGRLKIDGRLVIDGRALLKINNHALQEDSHCTVFIKLLLASFTL